MSSDPVIITAITTIGAILGGYMKLQGDRRETTLKKEVSSRSDVLKEANKHRKAQGEFNGEVVELLVRAEKKMDHLTDMHQRPDTAFATTGIEKKTDELLKRVSDLDTKANGIVTDVAVIKSNTQAAKG